MSNRPRIYSDERGLPTELEDAEGCLSILVEVPTTKKGEVRRRIVQDPQWLNNPRFSEFKKKPLDISLVLFLNKQRTRWQDVDNIAKKVLDGLKRHLAEPDDPYLFEDDSQVFSLLVRKHERDEVRGFDTDRITISFREHDPRKQMILRQRTEI